MSEPLQVRPGPLYRANKPVRDPAYLRFVKRFPCVACSKTWGVDPCHTGPHGLGQKSSDLSSIPLCRSCHREFDANPRGFVEIHHLDIPALTSMFASFYGTKIKREAA